MRDYAVPRSRWIGSTAFLLILAHARHRLIALIVRVKPVDFRKGADGLAALVRETMTADPFSGAVYVFRAKRADRIKLVFSDGTGLCLFAKRLEDDIFRWPKIEDSMLHLSAAQLSALLKGWIGGVSMRRVRRLRRRSRADTCRCGEVNQPRWDRRKVQENMI